MLKFLSHLQIGNMAKYEDVDLAGKENLQQPCATKDTAREANEIIKSLSQLRMLPGNLL